MLKELLIRVAVIAITLLVLFIQWSVMSFWPANKMGWSQRTRTRLNRAAIGVAAVIALVLALIPLESYPGFLVALLMIVVGFHGIADGLFQISFSDLRPQFWGNSYKPISERVLGAEGRRSLRRTGRMIGGVFFLILGIALMIAVLF